MSLWLVTGIHPNHPAAKRAKAQARRPAKRKDDGFETVLGRNPVVECLRAGVPATALYVALGTQADERLTESVTLAADSGIAILEVPRTDLDRMTTNGLHQGIALQVPPYNYLHPDDLLKTAIATPPALLVALDNISDPRNLGAIVRSVAAFGGHGVAQTAAGADAVAAGILGEDDRWTGSQSLGGALEASAILRHECVRLQPAAHDQITAYLIFQLWSKRHRTTQKSSPKR